VTGISSVNLKCSSTTRDLAKKAAALLDKTLFDYVDEIVLSAAKTDLGKFGSLSKFGVTSDPLTPDPKNQ
jgi:hypothetical protein